MMPEPVAVDVSQDWMMACSLQERFMESSSLNRQTLIHNARCRQMRGLGGDCFLFVLLPGRRVALSVADASGKSLPAALMIANVQSSIRTAALFAPEDPAAVVTAVNRQLHACSPINQYATLFYAVFDEDNRTLHYVNAGHNPALVILRNGAVTCLEASAPPVGLFAETIYVAEVVQLHPGDLILGYTDGIIEATNSTGEEWGIERLLSAVNRCRTWRPQSIVKAVFGELDQFSRTNQNDDATLFAALVQ